MPLWGIPTHFRYAPRRVECAEHGVVVEQIPWSEGKRPVTRAMMGFLARWARRLSWRETAQVFQTSWEAVYRSVEWFVQWGLAQRQLQFCCRGIGTRTHPANEAAAQPVNPRVPDGNCTLQAEGAARIGWSRRERAIA